MKICLSMLSLALLALSAGAVAKADTVNTVTTYSYTGKPFTIAEGPYTTSDYVTGSFFAPTLAPNLNHALLDVYSFSFNDGVQTLTGAYEILGSVSTDSNGALTNWDLFPGMNTYAGFCSIEEGADRDFPGTQCENTGYYKDGFAENGFSFGPADPNGTGTYQTSVTPEPSSIALFGTGLAGIVEYRRRRADLPPGISTK